MGSNYNSKSSRKGFFAIITDHQLSFVCLFIGIFSVAFSLFYIVGFIPNEITVVDTVQQAAQIIAENKDLPGEEPLRIKIATIGVDSLVQNPKSNDVDILDAALLKSAVHYPGSGLAGKGNMFIFGHSSNLEIVNNQAYKVFSDLRKLNTGDVILIESKDKEYTYTVRTVSLLEADEALVDLSTKKKMLTLSTCDTFGHQKQKRYVVEADFTESHTLK